MAIYAVKYNPSGNYIPGATQVGTLAVAIGDVDYSTGGWVAGVSDDNGYVIYSDTSSLNLTGRTTGGNTGIASSNMPTFYRSQFKTDQSLLQLINRIPGNTQSFNDINSAKAWLNAAAHVNILGGTYSSGGGTSSPGSTASYIVTIKEVGSNIVMAGSGTLNIDGLTLVAGATGPMGGAGIGINSATFILGANGGYFDQYSGILTNPSNFGTGGGNGSSTSAGDIVGLVYNGAPPHLLIVPVGYTSGSYLTSSQTFNSQTFTSLGLVAGTYSYTWGTGSSAEILSVVVGGTASGGGGGGGGATGSGSWYFYAAEGNLTGGPPSSNGQAIFTDNLPAGGTNVTFNPNKSGGVNFLNFKLQDSAGTDYTTQFTNLQNNGGTVSVIQNGITATYTLTSGMAFIQSSPGFVAINANAATQTVTATSNFVYADPISISFS
jgi:hypothetical protein